MANSGLFVTALCLFLLVNAEEDTKGGVQEVIRSVGSSSCGDALQTLATYLKAIDTKLDLYHKDVQSCTNGHTFTCTYGICMYDMSIYKLFLSFLTLRNALFCM